MENPIEPISLTPAPKSNLVAIVLTALITAIVVGVVMYVVMTKDEELVNTPTPTYFVTSTPTASQNITSNWNTYTNDVYKYQFQYPVNFGVSVAEKFDGMPVNFGMTFDQAYAKYTGKVCVSVDNKLYISAPINETNGFVLCTARTGGGSDTRVTSRNENIVIDGITYDMQISDYTSKDSHAVGYVVTLSDDTRISFEVIPGPLEDQMKEIIRSYKKI